jgi:putative membrane protein
MIAAMMRFIASIVVALVVSAVALLVAALLLDGFDVSTVTFPVLVVEFAAILLIARLALETVIDKNVHILSSFVGLIGAFVALVVTDVLSDGLSIDGVSTWIFATLIVWGGMLIAGLLFGAALFRRIAGEDRRR